MISLPGIPQRSKSLIAKMIIISLIMILKVCIQYDLLCDIAIYMPGTEAYIGADNNTDPASFG